jgi:RNA polymerase sigma factor (sigma-70 family)
MSQAGAESVLRHLRQLVSSFGDVPDGVLLQRYLDRRDEAAFVELVRRHGPAVLAACRATLADPHAAEDVFQATFFVLARRGSSVRCRDRVGAWLHGVACRLARRARADAVRRRVREEKVARPAEAVSPNECTWREAREAIHQELARLPEQYRAPLILCYLEGLTQDEAARRLGWPATTVKGRVNRGRALLQRRLGRRGFTSDGMAALLPQTTTPLSLVEATASAALKYGAGEAVAPGPAALAEIALHSWSLTRAQALIAAVVLLGVLGAGVAGLLPHAVEPLSAPPLAAPEEGVARGPAPRPGEDLDGQPLPRNAVARLGSLRFRHGGHGDGLVASPDGQFLASLGRDSWVRIWDAETGLQQHGLRHEHGVYGVAWLPDGRAATIDSMQAFFWDLSQRSNQPRRFNPWGFSRALSPDGTLAILEIRPPREEEDRRTRYVLWDLVANRERHELEHGNRQVRRATFSPDGKLVAIAFSVEKPMWQGWEAVIAIWDTASGRCVHGMHEDRTSQEHSCQIVLAPDNRTYATVTGGDEPGGGGEVLHLRDLATGKELHRLLRTRDWRQYFTALHFAPDGGFLAAGDSLGDLRLWEAVGGKEVLHIHADNGPIRSLASLAGGKQLASLSYDGVIRIWDTTTGRELRSQKGHASRIGSVAVAPDGRTVFTASDDGTARAWDAATGRELRRFKGHERPVTSVAISPDGRTLATAGLDGSVRLWDPRTGKQRSTLNAPGFVARSVAFAPDGRTLVAAGQDDNLAGVCVLWDVATGKRRWQTQGSSRSGWLNTVAMSPDGKLVLSGGDFKPVQVRDAETGKIVRTLGGDRNCLRTLTVAADCRTLASGGEKDGRVIVWDLVAGKELYLLTGDLHSVGAVAFSPDGRMLASAAHEGVIRVWETATGKERRVLREHAGGVLGLAFFPDGRRLVSAGADSTALIWDVFATPARGEDASSEPLPRLWERLAGEDAAAAFQAMGGMLARPRETEAFLLGKLRQVPRVELRQVAGLLIDLDSDDFDTREQATEALERLGGAIEPALREAVAKQPSPEVRRRVQRIRDTLARVSSPEGQWRRSRVLEVLARLGTVAARAALRDLAGGVLEIEP